MDFAFSHYGFDRRRLSPGVLGLVLAAHGMLLWAASIQRYDMPVAPVEQSILISLVAPESEVTQPRPVEPPRVIKPVNRPIKKKVEKRPRPVEIEPLPQLVASAPEAEASAPGPVTAPVEPIEPEAAQAMVEPDAPVEPVVLEEPIEQPRFNANYLDNPAPSYPAVSRRLREEGRVLLRVRVDANGTPSQITLHQSSGFDRLDVRAAETVKRWKFVPARQGGTPVAAWVIVPIQFSLKG